MIIREATLSDIPAIASLAKQTYIETFGPTMTKDELHHALEERTENYFYSVLGKDTLLISLEDEVIVGFIQFGEVRCSFVKPELNDIELHKIFINTSHHSKGIGTQLMDAMFSNSRLKDTKNIYLDVYPKNTKAIGLYTKYGFQTIGNIPYIANGEIVGNDLLMKLTLKK